MRHSPAKGGTEILWVDIVREARPMIEEMTAVKKEISGAKAEFEAMGNRIRADVDKAISRAMDDASLRLRNDMHATNRQLALCEGAIHKLAAAEEARKSYDGTDMALAAAIGALVTALVILVILGREWGYWL